MKRKQKKINDATCIVGDYADEQRQALKEQKESVALACVLRSIYIYRKAGADAMDIDIMIGYVMDSLGIKEFNALDEQIISDILVHKYN